MSHQKSRIVTYFIVFLQIPFMLFGQQMPQNLSEGLDSLEVQVQTDLYKINFPRRPWLIHSTEMENPEILDVAIVGGGVAGTTASFALMKEGIANIQIFDEHPPYHEGSWINCARMSVLRSDKEVMGPALGVASLTFWSWYEARYGNDAWENLQAIPTKLWHEYLCWFRKVLHLPVKNNMTLVKLQPIDHLLELTFDHEGSEFVVYARKVVLATGRAGSGGNEIPEYLKRIEKRFYAHTHETIDSCSFNSKKIAVIGGGASAFDAAAVAIENGAKSVDIFVRRSTIASTNKISPFCNPGMENGFYFLSNEMRSLLIAEMCKPGNNDPSVSAIERIKNSKNLYIHYNTAIQNVIPSDQVVTLHTNRGKFKADYVIAGTGYDVDLSRCKELDVMSPMILLWKNHVPQDLLQKNPMLGRFPYLGPSFEFMENEPGIAPFLKNIYCFNYGALLSHGLLSVDILGISSGAIRLAKGIAKDFLLDKSLFYLEKVQSWDTPNFNAEEYPSLSDSTN